MSDVRRAVVRERRQITLPADVCRELGIDVGDSVQMEVDDGSLRLTPSKRRALDALEAIQRAFAESGVTEEEFQEELRKARKELVRERYGLG